MMKNIIVLFLMLCCVAVSAENLDLQTDIHSYEFKFTKLAEGTIPANSSTFYKNHQTMLLSWVMSTQTQPYSEQPDPEFFTEIVDSLILPIDNNLINYNDTTASIYQSPEQLDVGEWQIQVRVSRVGRDGLVWSKYTDSIPFYTDEQELPFRIPAFFRIQFE